MNRSEQRTKVRKNQKFAKEIKKLTPNQLKLMDALTEHKTDQAVDIFIELISKAMFKAMRDNKIGEDRANRIMHQANKIALEEMEDKHET